MSPRVPLAHMVEEDITIPRICVAKSVAAALKGKYGCFGTKVPVVRRAKHVPSWANFYTVYTTLVDNVQEPIGVPDSYLTKELWVMEPTTFHRIGHINCFWDENFDKDSPNYGHARGLWNWCDKIRA